MTFGEWLESERMTGNTDTEYLSAWLGWTAGQKAEREKRKPLTDEEITEIMLANGFTIKEGCGGLKPYVFTAVRAIERRINGEEE